MDPDGHEVSLIMAMLYDDSTPIDGQLSDIVLASFIHFDY